MLRRVREYMQFKLGHKTYVGMLHRLDRDTSGSLAVALSKDAHAAGRELFKAHRFERHYLALVQGIPESARRARSRRASRRVIAMAAASWSTMTTTGLESATDYKVRERLKDAALLELRLHTGRQHQIRLHLEKIGHPLIGERVYSGERTQTQASASASSATSAPRRTATCCTPGRSRFRIRSRASTIAVEAPLPSDFRRG